MTDKLIMTNVQSLPERLKEEVLDFVLFLKNRDKEKVKNVPKVGRKLDTAKGKIIMAPDFDEPLEEFKAYM